VEEMVDFAKNNLHEEAILLFHDGGGNREKTINSLKPIIDFYKSKGYDFVTVDELVGIEAYL